MHIGIFTNNYLPNPYGVSTSVEGFRKGLEKKGHRISIFAPTWCDEVYEDSSNIYRYPSFKVPTKVSFSIAVPYSSKIDKEIRSMKFDLIHAQHPNLIGAQAKRWAKEKNIPLIYTWHSIYDKYAHYASPIPEKIAAKWVIDNAIKFAKNADHVIVPTKSMLEIIKDKGFSHDNVHIIHSGVDKDLFSNPEGNKLRSEYDIPDDAILLMSISRMTEEKNVCFLARVIKKVLIRNKDAYFLFGGEGDLFYEVREILRDELISGRIIFVGKIDRELIKNYLDAADIFVYASITETQGTIISEAMYMGLPVVAVKASGVKDMVIDGRTGYLTDESIDDMVYAVLRCITEDSDRQSLAKEAELYAKENYTIEVCTEKLLDVYNQAILGNRI